MMKSPTTPTTERKFWVIDHVIQKSKRWMWSVAPESDAWLWKNGGALWGKRRLPAWPKPAPLFVYDTFPPGAPYDTPVPDQSMLIVSSALRDFFEREAPRSLAYYPIRVKGPESDKLPLYFACRFRQVWDCLHPYAWDEDENGRFVSFPVIDESKIPVNGLIGSVKHFEVEWLMHDSIKRKIAKEGFTGFDLRQPAPFASRSEATSFVHANRPRSIDVSDGGALESSQSAQKVAAKKKVRKSKVTK